MRSKIIIGLFSAATGGLFSEIIETFINAKGQFIAILVVVAFDFTVGIIKAVHDKEGFKTYKLFKTLAKLVLFWCLLATVLSLEAGFPYASFLSEAIMLPILVLLLMKSLKKFQEMGYINSETLSRITGNIDKHKNQIQKTNTSEEVIPEVD
jgi:uncharacterized membrane protein YiaA